MEKKFEGIDPTGFKRDKEKLSYRFIVLNLVSKITKSASDNSFLKDVTILRELLLPHMEEDKDALKKLKAIDAEDKKKLDKMQFQSVTAKSNTLRTILQGAYREACHKKSIRIFAVLSKWLAENNYLSGRGGGVNDES